MQSKHPTRCTISGPLNPFLTNESVYPTSYFSFLLLFWLGGHTQKSFRVITGCAQGIYMWSRDLNQVWWMQGRHFNSCTIVTSPACQHPVCAYEPINFQLCLLECQDACILLGFSPFTPSCWLCGEGLLMWTPPALPGSHPAEGHY